RRQLEAEAKLERREPAELRESLANPALSIVGQRQGRRDVRRRIEQARPVFESVMSQCQALGHGLDAVVPGGHNVRVNVDETGLHPARLATRRGDTAAD